MDKLWQKNLLEIGGQPLLDIMMEVFRMQEHNSNQIKELQTGLAVVVTGFPKGDIAGHAAYHESIIRWHELRNQILRAALEKVTQAGAVAAFGYLALLVWEWFKVEVKK